MDKLDNQSLIHKGHRKRMKDKLLMHGQNIFDTYELLEMLLYMVIPYKDTNPTAKRLLIRFGSLSGVLNASVEELKEVEGIGNRAAEFLTLAGEYGRMVTAVPEKMPLIINNCLTAGEYFVKLFSEDTDCNVALILLDNSMRVIRCLHLECDDFGSAAMRPGFFLDEAVKSGACSIIVGCRHRFGALHVTSSELATYKSVKLALADLRIDFPTIFVVSGKKYTQLSMRFDAPLYSKSEELDKFIESIDEEVRSVE